ncbi:MAG: uroporphyrinogen decarboxylase family protein, partial [Anaerolineae bacterium]
PALDSAVDVGRLTIPDIETHPRLIYFREAVRLMAAEHGADVPVAAIALSPVDLPIMLMGIGGWLETVLFDKPGAHRILEMTIPYFVSRINDLFAAGAAFVVTPSAFVNPGIVTRNVIAQLALPALHTAFAQVNGPLVMHSGGARLAPFLDLFRGLPNVAGFVVNCDEDLALARQKAGPDALLIGNVDGPKLCYAAPETIQADCARLLRDRAGDARFILGTSAADIAYQTPPEHIHAISQAVRAVSVG